ncbi:hypothetical protein EYC84_000352 [Monilinia fructicola]|uniref:Uncharacterized protein n=1 Tax=Monilinia fructicola TaxID=38448 RepID=A0A5M9JSD4_MONFR|nr:hypothetical protein EYC84_000352 [Monilinia fructicola]
MLTAEEHLVDVLLNRKPRRKTNQPKISTKPNCTIARTPGQQTATIIDANPAIKHPSPIIVTTLQYSEVNARHQLTIFPTNLSSAARIKVMSLENEAKIDKVMERVTGINCRRGLGMQSEDIASGLSYGYGFYWTCCNDICAKARVMGNLGGVMEVTVKGPCKRKNSLAEEKCGECGHSICAICEKIAECAGSNKEKRGGHLTD